MDDIARVFRPGVHLYDSEPVYGGTFKEVIRVFNDERVVRSAAQAALDSALSMGAWTQAAERRFEMPVGFRGCADFEQRMMRPTFIGHLMDKTKLAATRAAFERHIDLDGANPNRPIRVRLLRLVD